MASLLLGVPEGEASKNPQTSTKGVLICEEGKSIFERSFEFIEMTI